MKRKQEPATTHEAQHRGGGRRRGDTAAADAPAPDDVCAADSDDDVPDMSALVLEDARRSAPQPLPEVVATALAGGDAAAVLAHLLHPLPLQRFEAEVYEQHSAVVLRRGSACRGLLDGLLSKARIDALLRSQRLCYGLHVDVTRYDARAGRSTLNDGERVAVADDVWRHYAAGASVRILHPQRWVDSIHDTLAALERHFNCACGCNAYLTPPGTQGFAPHYDDIDAFVLQLEGRKRWRLYAPRLAEEQLPRTSSPNFAPGDIGEPILDVTLAPGDVLYMPRGCIHQAEALPDHHSLHITLSTGHANAWVDLFELALPAALADAAEQLPALRRNIPRELLACVGVMHAPEVDEDAQPQRDAARAALDAQREAFILHAQALLRQVLEHAPLDAAADQLAARFMRTRLPPRRAQRADGPLQLPAPKLSAKSSVRLAFRGAARLVVEAGEACVYHPFANDRAASMEGYAPAHTHSAACGDGGCCAPDDPARLVFALEAAPALEVQLRALPLERVSDGIAIANRLLRAGVLVADE